ncbi:hypothetical protein ACFLU7_00390 [Chloroflexota bacterium]
MPFRIPRKALNEFFKLIRNEVDLEFDLYYFCFMAGIATGRKETIPESMDVVAYFPGEYRHRGKLLIALFLYSEMKQLGVKMNEKSHIYSEISRLVNPESQDHLSDEGLREFNRYAQGGYKVLEEWFDNRPQSLEAFLRRFKVKIDETLNST